jgi:hypothetical protein
MNLRRIVSVFFAIISMCGAALWAQTYRSGVLEKDERWKPDMSPIVINNDLLIPRGTRLGIAPGTEIRITRPTGFDPRIHQRDALDSTTTTITVEGILACVGRADRRIRFTGLGADSTNCSWYGIVLDSAVISVCELAFTDVVGACNGLTITECSPLIRNCVFEYNNVGIVCADKSGPTIYNCVVAHNHTAGIRTYQSNPVLFNNIIVYNRNNGLWCDGISRITFAYNCVFGNADGDLLGCNPELGVVRARNSQKDSVDFKNNLFTDPIFKGSVAESLAVEHDFKRPTDKSRIKDTALAKIMHPELPDSSALHVRHSVVERYELSSYSPCRNAGNPQALFDDDDGSKNDMGIWGGPEFFGVKKKAGSKKKAIAGKKAHTPAEH